MECINYKTYVLMHFNADFCCSKKVKVKQIKAKYTVRPAAAHSSLAGVVPMVADLYMFVNLLI